MSTTHRSLAGLALVLVAVLASLLVAPTAADARAGTTTRLTGATQVSTGSRIGCVRLQDGRARCWGDGTPGSLGNGTFAISTHATLVRNETNDGFLRGIRQVVTGDDHACALLTSGQVRCWGANDRGQLGDGSTNPRSYPGIVRTPAGNADLSGVSAISAGGDTTCAVLGGGVVCWGEDGHGQTGAATASLYRVLPAQVVDTSVAPLTGVTQLDNGLYSTCARTSAGQAWCWGGNDAGQLGNGTTDERRGAAPVLAPTGTGPLAGVAAVTVGHDHACARLSSGQARCWGDNEFGRIGDGTVAPRLLPATVTTPAGSGPLTGVRAIRAGGATTCAQLANGQVRCWGFGFFGTLGTGTFTPSVARPAVVRNPAGRGPLGSVRQLALGGLTACTVVVGGEVRCWGNGTAGAIGDGHLNRSHALPVPVRQGPVVT